ncbi:TolC family protein [Granulicella mallensis]|uniref:Outer membrane protein TolC n=1 Tax=Granulicella mallensis TaxID=940614 RepID=A0A7W8EBJ8_9BACT|nr:TolC family protein [Granulicella mallensis]MBB5064595.1 outer membrane protein TolC [Granulicella mallensis]
MRMMSRRSISNLRAGLALCLALPLCAKPLTAQSASTRAATTEAVTTISLDEAIRRAEANESGFASASAESRASQLDRSIARAGLLPSASFHNQYLFTQGNGSGDRIGQTANAPAPRFIANNAVHEYASQGVVNETVGLQQFSAVSLADANAAKAAAEMEIARRGLVSAVVTLYYGLISAETKLTALQGAADEANHFVTLTQQRQEARESAHADVVKAQLQQQQRTRDLADAQVSATRARLELGVLLFPDPRTAFKTEATAVPVLPDRSDIEADAAKNNAELKSALASLHASQAEVTSARAAYLPDLGLNFTYGVDAPQFAAKGPDGARNLGYSASATLDIPLWDWLATQHKVKQSEIRRDAAKVALSAAQRRLIANLAEFYDEAAAARDQLASLDQSIMTAQESLRLTRLRYTGGEGTVFEVVDAQNTLLSAEAARADGAVRYQVALANLQTLTGRF